MEALVKRLVVIVFCLVISMVMIYKVQLQSPLRVPKLSYKVACIPAPKTKEQEDEIDKKLKPYFHVAHTTKEDNKSDVKSYRCYFRFPVHDIACVPPHVAKRTNKVRECPRFLDTEETQCYFLDRKYAPLLGKLRAKPAISKEEYGGKVVKNWKQIRDILLGK